MEHLSREMEFHDNVGIWELERAASLGDRDGRELFSGDGGNTNTSLPADGVCCHASWKLQADVCMGGWRDGLHSVVMVESEGRVRKYKQINNTKW